MNKKIASIILFNIGFIAAFLFITLRQSILTILSIFLKITPTLMMCIWLFIMSIDKSNWMIFFGLLFSMACDIFMALNGPLFLAAGIISNMIALIFYTIYFIRSDTDLNLVRIFSFIIVIGVIYLILFDYLGQFKIPVLIYCLIYIIFMWRSASRLGDSTISVTSQYACYIGCTAIVTSDALLSALIFNIIPTERKYQSLVMILWWGGLFLLMVTAEIKRKGKLHSIFIK